jgi:hypothetical protein
MILPGYMIPPAANEIVYFQIEDLKCHGMNKCMPNANRYECSNFG